MANIFHDETKDMSEEERIKVLNEKLEKLREMYGYTPHTAQVPCFMFFSTVTVMSEQCRHALRSACHDMDVTFRFRGKS